MRLASMAFTVGNPTQTSRRRCVAAKKIARAGTSGSKIGATGLALTPILFIAQSNCGVFTADRSTVVRWTANLSWMISERSASVSRGLLPWLGNKSIAAEPSGRPTPTLH